MFFVSWWFLLIRFLRNGRCGGWHRRGSRRSGNRIGLRLSVPQFLVGPLDLPRLAPAERVFLNGSIGSPVAPVVPDYEEYFADLPEAWRPAASVVAVAWIHTCLPISRQGTE